MYEAVLIYPYQYRSHSTVIDSFTNILFSLVCRLTDMHFYRYAIIYKKGYQDFDNVQSVVTTKVKGIVMVNTSIHPDIQSIWDVADYIVPPQVNFIFIFSIG